MTYNSYKLKCKLFLCFNWNLQASFGHLPNILVYDHGTLFRKWLVFYKTNQIMKQMSTAIKPQGIWTQVPVRWKAHYPGLATRDQYLDLYLEGFLVTTLTLRNRLKSPLKLWEGGKKQCTMINIKAGWLFICTDRVNHAFYTCMRLVCQS